MSEIAELLKQHTKTVEDRLNAVETKEREHSERLIHIEQKAARSPGSGRGAESYGEQFTRSDTFAAYKVNGYQGKARIGLKAITSAQAGGVWSDRDLDTQGLARRTFKIRDLLTLISTESGSVDYARQTTRTNNAAVVAEGALKPTSAYVWEQVNLQIRTIAHITKLTRQAMDDHRQLADEVDSEMRYGLQLAEDTELLSGDGTGAHLTGMIPAATDFAAPFTMVDPNMIDVIGLALLQQSLTEYPTDGIVLHPTDWMKMRLIKDADGKYILGDPNKAAPPVLFDRPIALTQAMPLGTFLAGGFKLQKLYDRMSPEVLIASENEDDFIHNLYTMRCEERIGLALRKPQALVYGDFTTALASAAS